MRTYRGDTVIFHCDDCRRERNPPQVRAAPMLQDHVWAKIATPQEWLCRDCMHKRLVDCGVKLKATDFGAWGGD